MTGLTTAATPVSTIVAALLSATPENGLETVAGASRELHTASNTPSNTNTSSARPTDRAARAGRSPRSTALKIPARYNGASDASHATSNHSAPTTPQRRTPSSPAPTATQKTTIQEAAYASSP